MRNVTQIVQDALDEMGLPYPSGIVSATDPTERQARALVYAACRFFRSQRTFPQLKKKHTVTLAINRYEYPLPADYYAALPDTQWDEDQNLRLLGPYSDSAMTDRTIGEVGSGVIIAYRIFGPDINPASTAGQFKIDPVPTAAGGILSFEYISKNTFVDNTYTTYAETVAANTDYCLFDDDLMVAEFKWRWLRAKKKEFDVEYKEARALLEPAVNRWAGSYRGSMVGRAGGPRYSVPYKSWSL